MMMMNHSQIAENLRKLFSTGSSRIVFWYDGKRAFEPDFESLELDGVRKWRLDQHGPLATKLELERKFPEEKFLVYAPFEKPKVSEDWLLDIYLYSKEFRADKANLIKETLGLLVPGVSSYIAKHIDFFSSKERVERLSRYSSQNDGEDELDLKILTVISGSEQPHFEGVSLALFGGFIPLMGEVSFSVENQTWQEICKFGMDEAYWRFAKRHWGYASSKPSLKDLFIFLTVTHFHSAFPKGDSKAFPESLRRFVLTLDNKGDGKPEASVNAPVFISTWMQHAKLAPVYDKLSQEVESELNLEPLLERIKPAELKTADSFELVEKHLLIALREKILLGSEADLAEASDIIDSRRGRHWAEIPDFRAVYDALKAAVRLFRLKNRFANGFDGYKSASAMFGAYKDELFQFDQAYREFYTAAGKVTGGIDVLKNGLQPAIENFYCNNYLQGLSGAWDKHIQDELLAKWRISDVPFQTEFYKRYVQPILDERESSKAYVIVSDAMRYEIAEEIHRRVSKGDRIGSNIEAMLGVLPSITLFGMASLLPHKKFSITDAELPAPLIDGQPATSSTREATLKNAEPASVVVKANEFLRNTTATGREFVKNCRVIYIYHDRIDAIGDKAATEDKAFEAVETSIQEIVKLIEFIHGCLNGTRILLTADHGFLYQTEDLEDTDKSRIQSVCKVSEEKSRYAMGRGLPKQDGVWNMTFSSVYEDVPDADLRLPKRVKRFNLMGGAKFVHGGPSLQEVVVPVLKLKGLKGKAAELGKAKKVDVQLLGDSRRVSNNRQRFVFLQTTKVEGKIAPRTLRIGFKSRSGELISDETKLIFDSESEQLSERQKEIFITIKLGNYSRSEEYFLTLVDDETGADYNKIPFTINLGIANEFGF